ncbi:hypothetical protein KUTeg_005188 [Tegillarca granosa]|uniref:Uncharacterized protein n=1 Tax=Tegillarca granosa TaxID=220873 RepID=A0ABQ9FJ26_TEGGR|nr:hypothetical protein KUTeg_005188 [Tegillarca granosa]
MPLMSKNDKNCYSFRCCQRQHKTDTVEDNDLPVEKKMQKNMQVANDKTQDTEMENGTTWIKVARCIDDFCFYSSIFTTVILTVFILGNVAVLSDPNAPVMIYPAGVMQWTFGMSLATNCYCDVTYYPFDTQKCQFRFFVLGYNLSDVEVRPMQFEGTEPISMDYFQPNGEWEFVGKEIEIDEKVIKGEKSNFIIYHLRFRRRPLFHFINSLIPVTLFSSLSCATFRLPAESGEKIGFSVTVLLGFAVYLTILTDFIPTIYLVSVLCICVLVVFITTFVLECHHADPEKPVPIWTCSFVRNIRTQCNCKRGCRRGCWRRKGQVCSDTQTRNDDETMDEEIKTKSVEVTWQEVSKSVDQTAFVVFVVVSVVLTVIIYSLFVNDMSIIGDNNVPITVLSSGFFVWTFGIATTTNCIGDVTYYPFDTQSCQISFQLIGIGNEHAELLFTPYSDNLDMHHFRPNGEWEFVGNSTSIYSKTVNGYTVRSLNYIFKFRRRPLFHVINSLIPVTLFSSLSCAIFKVPADSGEKVGFCLTVLLGFAVYLTILTDFIPTIYLVVVLSFSVISVVITILVLHCHHKDQDTPISKRTKWIVRYILLPLTCNEKCCCRRCGQNKCEDSTAVEKTSDEYVEKEIKHEKKPLTWQYIGQIIDQAGFIIVVGATVLMTIFVYSILLHGYNKEY